MHWKEVKAGVATIDQWFRALSLPEKKKCRYYPLPKNKQRRVGYKKEQAREFFEVRLVKKERERRIKWWPRSASENSSLAKALQTHSKNIFLGQHHLAKTFLDIICSDMGYPATWLSRDLESCPPTGKAVVSTCMYRLYRYDNSIARWWKRLPLVSRIYESPGHADLGLITVSPRSSVPGLMLLDPLAPAGNHGKGKWVNIEKYMKPNDFIVFVGNAMADLTNSYYRPLFHRVERPAWGDRFSLPFFLRYPLSLKLKPLPACPARTSSQHGHARKESDSPSSSQSPPIPTCKALVRAIHLRRTCRKWRNPVLRVCNGVKTKKAVNPSGV